ncbi:MOSC domain-containing protein [Swaminathania salitolerans]|uniref:Molybdenum cofactor biosysynthesis protein n=1 Tax=Swaminathania salitolerans TaxID=182838 RepID=A0A511BLF9_9PROT|nr:MOSC N-terminal beta barrel domain-containing protein [Swaminathania salitolerans]GEL00932.1 molybdenum cofactor biosysynthesis protein [Swaminathania salitolerans]
MTRVTALYTHPVKSLHRVSCDFLDLSPWGPAHDRRWLIVDEAGQFLTQRQHPAMATIHVALFSTPERQDSCPGTGIPEDPGGGIVLSGPETGPLRIPCPDGSHALRAVRVWKDRDIPARDAGDDAAEWLERSLGLKCRLVFMDRPESARKADFGSVSFADGFPLLVTNTASLRDLNERLDEQVPMTRFRPNIVLNHALPWAEDGWIEARIGAARIAFAKPCSRCIVTTIDQEDGRIPVAGEPLRTLAKFRRQPGGVMFGRNAVILEPGRIALNDPVTLVGP